MKQIVQNIAIDVRKKARKVLTAKDAKEDRRFLESVSFGSLRLSFLTGFIGLILLNLIPVVAGWAQGTSTQQVLTLEVLELNKINISNTAITLIIDRANLQEGAPMPATNADGTLFWMTNGENKKITVASDNTSPRFKLRIVAEEIDQGTGSAVPEIVLNDNKTHDLVVGVSKNSGKCRIKYTAAAEVKDGTGRETYTITYTITGS